jgi:hypothetical protein
VLEPHSLDPPAFVFPLAYYRQKFCDLIGADAKAKTEAMKLQSSSARRTACANFKATKAQAGPLAKPAVALPRPVAHPHPMTAPLYETTLCHLKV